MTGGYSIRGGAGGVGADLDDMRSTARRLDTSGDALQQATRKAGGHAKNGALLRTAMYSPSTAVHAQVQLVDAAATGGATVVLIEAQASLLVARAELFELADAAGSTVGSAGEDLIGEGVLAGTVLVTVIGGASGAAGEARTIVADLLSGRLSPGDVAAIKRRLGSAAAAGANGAASQLLSDFPAITDIITGGADTIPGRLDSPFVRPSIEQKIALALGLAGLAGAGRDRRVTAGKPSVSAQSSGRQSLASILRSIGEIEATDDRSGVRVKRIDGSPPRWIVEIPGTSSWSPFAGGNPSDLTSNAQLMNRRGELLRGVQEAMQRAGIKPGEPVMLAGHSQGGIAAAALASDPSARRDFKITHVVTAGSPVARMPIPSDVHVLSIEHREDPVPRLDSAENPDRANWSTATFGTGDHDKIIDAHAGSGYADSAGRIPREHYPRGIDQFLDQHADAVDVPISRGGRR